jgi:hypothetical protein
MTKKSIRPVPGIDKVEKMESSGNFEVEKVIEVISDNKDIINNVEAGDSDAGDYSISVNLNIGGVSKVRLVDGVVDMFNRFNQSSVDLIADNGVRTLKFWWDSSARNI